MTFRTNALKVQAFAGALFGVQVGTTTMAQVNADITSNGGLANTLNGYYASSFGNVANATVAASVAANLGLTGDALASGTAYITAQLNGAAAGARGAVISNILDLFAGLASDATFGAAATAWNAKVDAANAYTGAANVAIGSTVSQGSAFTLTVGVDTPANTAGNDTYNATASTFNAFDSIDGGAGTDTLSITDTASALATATPTGVKVSNVERIVVSSSGTVGISDGVTAATATKQIIKITTGSVANSVDSYTVTFGGASNAATTSLSDGSATKAEAAALIAGAVNALAGASIAAAVGEDVIVTAPVAGVAIPAITVVSNTSGTADATNRAAVSTIQANVVAATAASATAWDVSGSGFAGVTSVNVSSTGGANIKASSVQDVAINNSTGGTVTQAGGKSAVVVTTGTSAVDVSGAALTSVSIKGGTGATVNNFLTAAGTDNNQGTTLTSVTLDTVNGNSTVGGQALTNLTVTGPVASARTVTVTNAATAPHTLNLTVNNTGYTTSTLVTEAQTVVNDTVATALNIVSSGTKNSLKIAGNTAATTVTISGSAPLKISDSTNTTTAASMVSVDGSAATGALALGVLHASTKTVTTGSGNDSLTFKATVAGTVNTNAGNDTVTLGSTLAAGSSISLGAGNDKVLSSSGSITTGVSATGTTTVIDGGDGTDGIAASLITAGSATNVRNFETLILDNTTGSVDGSILSGITGLELASAGGGTYTGLTPAQSLTVTNTAANTAATTLTFSSTSVAGTADSYAITFNASTPSGTTAEPSSANVLAATIAAAGVENVTIDSSGAAFTWNSITMGANANARTVAITGSKNLDITFPASGTSYFGSASGTIATGGGVSSIDGSAATGKLAINIGTGVTNAAVGLTVRGGSNSDTITLSTSQATVFGNGGNDTFDFGASVYGSGKVVQFIADGLQAGDKLTLKNQGTETWTSTRVDVSTATSLATAQGLALSSTDGSSNGAIKWFIYGNSTYVVQSNTNNATITEAATGDVVVRIAGIVDLSASTLSGNTLTIV